jgi:hypothetical protein
VRHFPGVQITVSPRMTTRRLEVGDIVAGSPLPCDIFDADSRLLLRSGQTIRDESQVARLLGHGVYGDLEDQRTPEAADTIVKRIPVYARMQSVRDGLEASLAGVAQGLPVLPDEIVRHARHIADLCALDPDAALATVLLQKGNPYGVRQMVNAAIVSELLLMQKQPDVVRRLPVLAAALTMNVSMLALQQTLYGQQDDLTAAQRYEIRRHPEDAAHILETSGVTDQSWLTVVRHHHETLDGTGYPGKLSGAEISLGAQIVGLADRYCAMVSERGYRPGASPNVALRQIFLAQGKSVDPMLAAMVVKEVGLYPPGTVVQLANGEIGIAMKRTLNSSHPVVRTILNGSGIRSPAMPKRRTSQPSFAITEVHPLSKIPPGIDPGSIWIPRETDTDDNADA